MKIQIFTILDFNYGNRLQNYALQKILVDMKYSVVTYGSNRACYFNKMSYVADPFIKKIIKSLIFRFKRLFFKFDYKKKNYNEFSSFNKLIYFKNKIDFKVNYYLVGSDKVWNLKLFPNQKIFMLGFSKNKCKNIAISPSISLLNFNNKEENEVRKYIYNFKKISCREIEGSKLLHELFSVNSTTILDPTLVLDSKEWIRIEKKPVGLKTNKYILIYFLGEYSIERKKIIDQLAFENKVEIINILSLENNIKIGPSEFIYLIRNSEIVLTDSYHALIFSYIFDKNIRVLNRNQQNIKSMNTRMESLMKVLNLPKEIFCSDDEISNSINNKYDYDYRSLQIEREKFLNYINDCIKK